jgi:protein phosphatase
LLCSDGLHDLVSDSEMQAIVAGESAHQAVQNLIQAARRNGGHDNITAALVHVFVPKMPTEADSKATREFSIPSE